MSFCAGQPRPFKIACMLAIHKLSQNTVHVMADWHDDAGSIPGRATGGCARVWSAAGKLPSDTGLAAAGGSATGKLTSEPPEGIGSMTPACMLQILKNGCGCLLQHASLKLRRIFQSSLRT